MLANKSTIQSPGVYINDLNAFPNSVVPVATAVPAFIGYTQQASFEGKSYLNVAQKINSFAEFCTCYCLPNPEAPVITSKQYNPQYYLVKQKTEPAGEDHMFIEDTFYSIVPDPDTIYYLYNSIRLFYENGGAAAYIVSVGGYGKPSGKPISPGEQIINGNITLNDLMKGLALLKNEQEPAMYICPDATLLSKEDNGMLMQAMLLQCSIMQTAICIFDIIGGRNPDPLTYAGDIGTFRNYTGNVGLSYGAAYYPFVSTTLVQNADIDYTNLCGGDISQLEPLLNPPGHPNPGADAVLKNIQDPVSAGTVLQNNNALLIASETYNLIIKHVLAAVNILPASGGMAGVITISDNESGVWKAPANRSIIGAVSVPINLSETQQADLNIDAITGKSINAIRMFKGRGILVWGARTLDGNSQDWKYIAVRRTIMFIEQSCKLAAKAYVFAPNDQKTWEAVKAMTGSFLTTIWKEGGLQGTTPADAFAVECGLGTTMTADDILHGFMNITIQVAVLRPAEYIVFTFQQQQARNA